jgi:amino-acid N-acetyltransferase
MEERDRQAVHALLRSHGLPTAGFDEPHVSALVARDGPTVVGSAAVERYERYGLLRSVAVADSHRGRQLGQRLTRAAISLARTQGLTGIYLLTETAAGFFPKFGFTTVSREQIPEAVKQSVEFTSVCPASAHAFALPL